MLVPFLSMLPSAQRDRSQANRPESRKSSRILGVILGLGLMAVSIAPERAEAAVLNVTFSQEARMTSVGDVVFGETSTGVMSGSFTLDTSAPGSLFRAQGTQIDQGTFAGFDYFSDYYGYQLNAISNFSVTFGTQTWDINDLVDLAFGDNTSAYVYFSDEPVDGGSPNIFFRVSSAEGSLGTLGPSCSGSLQCGLTFTWVVVDNAVDPIRNRAQGGAITANVTAVPLPPAAALMVAGLAALGGMRLRRSRRPV